MTAAWLCLLIGLADIAQVVMPSFYQRTHLHKINSYVPGTLTNLTRTVDVLIGLMLLMLSHGLRRRKRRAWEAATLLLAFSIVVHLARLPHVVPAVAAAGVLAALLYFRDEFYAVGDPRTRWRALAVFAGLVVADVAIGLTYMLLARGLAHDYSFVQRTQHVIYGRRRGWVSRTQRRSGTCSAGTATGTPSVISRSATTRASSGRPPASPALATGWSPG